MTSAKNGGITIGLAGGINTYAYALSNPIGNADPTGEFVPLLLGAYAAVEFALSAWDAYDTFKTITSDCATTGEKWTAGGLFAAGIILPGNYGAIEKIAKKTSIWTATKRSSSVENAYSHYKAHGNEFGSQNALKYVKSAEEFMKRPPSGSLSKTRSNGDVLRYHPETNTFGVMDKDGSIRTMFKPAPRSAENPRGYDPNKYKTPLEYFYDQ